jgi:hypothetical protein
MYFRPVDAARPRLLAVVARFHWMHLNYMRALGEHFEVLVAWSGEDGNGVVADGTREGLRSVPIGWIPDDGADEVRSRLERVLSEWPPDIVQVLYYDHNELTSIARELVGDSTPVVYECSDPQTSLKGAGPGSQIWTQERDALHTSDACIFVSRAMRSYFERSHGLDLGGRSLIKVHGFARDTVAPPSPKLSQADGRVHIALVGTAVAEPGNQRWYGEVIPALVSQGLVVHSHFYDLDDPRVEVEPYRALAAKLDDYHFHDTVTHRRGTALSDLVSRYDLMGTFYHPTDNPSERITREVHLPAKAVCGWLHGGIPTVCFAHQRGVAERSEELGIGFVIESWEDLARIASDRQAIAAATQRCLECRDRFTNEHIAARIREFYGPLLENRGAEMSADAGERLSV